MRDRWSARAVDEGHDAADDHREHDAADDVDPQLEPQQLSDDIQHDQDQHEHNELTKGATWISSWLLDV